MMLTAALLVSVWQVRGSRFSLPLACVPLAIWVAGWRRHAETKPGAASSLKLAGAWLVSFHVTWILAALGIWYLFVSAEAVEQLAKEKCYKQTDYAQLAAMPAENVLVISNLGAPVLRHTPHRVLAGPYHRNHRRQHRRTQAFIGTPAKAGEIARANSIGLVAFCRGKRRQHSSPSARRTGCWRAARAAEVPDWMEIVPESRASRSNCTVSCRRADRGRAGKLTWRKHSRMSFNALHAPRYFS